MKRIFTKVLFLIIGAVSLAAAPEICHSSWGGCHITGVYFDQLDYTEFTISCTDGFYLKNKESAAMRFQPSASRLLNDHTNSN